MKLKHRDIVRDMFKHILDYRFLYPAFLELRFVAIIIVTNSVSAVFNKPKNSIELIKNPWDYWWSAKIRPRVDQLAQ